MNSKLIDRQGMIAKLRDYLQISPGKMAVIAVDMHRGHLDPSVATLPVPPDECQRVIGNTKRLFDLARGHSIPIVHVVLQQRPIGREGFDSLKNPWWKAIDQTESSLIPSLPSSVARHNIEGSPQTQFVDEIAPAKGDYVIRTKRRLSSFYGTDLEILLRNLGIDTLVIIGINTNTCVLNTCFDGFNRDFRIIVVSDCVASMYGSDLHDFGLQNISRCIGWVLTLEELEKKLQGRTTKQTMGKVRAV